MKWKIHKNKILIMYENKYYIYDKDKYRQDKIYNIISVVDNKFKIVDIVELLKDIQVISSKEVVDVKNYFIDYNIHFTEISKNEFLKVLIK